MKRLIFISLLTMLLSSCAAFKSATIGDDIYTQHNPQQIAEQQKQLAEIARARAEAQQAAWESKLAEAKALAAEKGVVELNTVPASINPYDAVLADDYQSAYARRLYGFSSPSYKMPSSYYTYRYSDAYHYASAYDPAFYNIMVSGDQVWVEPKYITSMFGSWGASVVIPTYGWYYGWASPRYNWWYGYPRYSWYDWGWGSIYDPYWGWSFGWGGYPYHPGFIPPHHHHHYYPPHYGHSHHHHRTIATRPVHSSNPGSRPAYISGGNYNTPQSGVSSSSRYQNRSQSGTVTGNGQYRGNSSYQGQYRDNSRPSSSQTRSQSTFNQRNDSNSFRGSNSYGGGYSGGYSGGGNSSGGYHGGGQGRR